MAAFVAVMSVAGPGTGQVPRSYEASFTTEQLVIDGRLNEAAWRRAPLTESFVDIRGPDHPAPRWSTHAQLAWDDRYLYVGASLEEPHLWATLTERDAIVYHDHDFEVFLDPDGDGLEYFEIEINALGTILDLYLDRPYTSGGQADLAWDVDGLRSAVHLAGTLNDATDVDRGWTVELAIPWAALGVSRPSPGEVWRVNFSRVQWPLRTTPEGAYLRDAEPSFEVHHEDNWVWSPQGTIDMHIPKRWGRVRFVEGP
jgi:hypothetical protein